MATEHTDPTTLGKEGKMSTPTTEEPTSALLVGASMRNAARMAVLAAPLAFADRTLRLVMAETSGVFDALAHADALTNPQERLRAHLERLEGLLAQLAEQSAAAA